ncbi:MAG TPA: Mu transposase C-terminal domain-containing protein [Sulfuricurvum sp.]|nr:Mu transposase C-terminal domain-containing protein [Sulfuricurvum sp.]
MSIRLEKNEIVYFVDTRYMIEAVLNFETVMAKNTETGKSDVLRISHLTSSPLSEHKNQKVQDLSQIPEKLLQKAQKRLEAIQPVYKSYSRQVVEERAKELGVSIQSMYNWINAYRANEQLSSLVFEGTNGGRGKGRLDEKIEMIIQNAIKDYYLTPQKPTVTKLHEEIAMQCAKANLDAPGVVTIRRRVQEVNEYNLLKKREGKKAAGKLVPIKNEYPDGNYPLEVLMIDHTRVDIIVVDNHHRIELGRPWITVAIDVFSRMVAGFYISMEAPGYFATGQCIGNAMLPKEKLLEKYKIKSKWPVWGIPKMIHMDNAKEFRSNDIERACLEYGISIVWRPVGRPHFGGHIERLLKTLHDDIHTLRGTTFSDIQKRGEYDSQKMATMTLDEFEEWITILIADVYHNKIHSALGKSPLKRYEEGIFGSDDQPPRGMLSRIEDEQSLRINLLPAIERTVQPYGIQLENIYYYSEVLNNWIGATEPGSDPKRKRKFIVRQDPRDISRIYFYDPQFKHYYEIPYRNTRHPAVSIWEFRAAQRSLKEQEQREYSEDEIFEALDRLRQIEAMSEQKTKAMRRNQERRTQSLKAIGSIEPVEKPPIVQGPEIDDDFDDIQPYSGIED